VGFHKNWWAAVFLGETVFDLCSLLLVVSCYVFLFCCWDFPIKFDAHRWEIIFSFPRSGLGRDDNLGIGNGYPTRPGTEFLPEWYLPDMYFFHPYINPRVPEFKSTLFFTMTRYFPLPTCAGSECSFYYIYYSLHLLFLCVLDQKNYAQLLCVLELSSRPMCMQLLIGGRLHTPLGLVCLPFDWLRSHAK
jgi:hypothetical protein